MARIVRIIFLLFPILLHAQHDIYVDGKGVMRWQKDNKEAYFFGINYTVPFAYGYRSVLRTGISIEKAIDNDVYHFARLGVNAFRVHVWDTEITDAEGNLLNNEHLRLFDYLLSALEQRGIRIMLTPLAFWGNGYPEKDSLTGSFSSLYNKQRVLVEEPAIKAQENYLKQLLAHVNPYTKKKYRDDRFIIGLEINNEPHHSGTLQQASDYISRMVRSVKQAGWQKPIFYNISESPGYAKAVAESDIQGVSFQWYPTGLVANYTLQGNFLPNVDVYAIPFDTIAAFRNKARIVYEFDAADILSPVMYPAMARSFRKSGFQWATQFAYDPMSTADGNTEYQTHYLNLVYTPEKAISLMIAAKVFRDPSFKADIGRYPSDTIFSYATIHPQKVLSEWNAPASFYYTGSTTTAPMNITELKNIAGSGNSDVVKYSGNGAYFLDRLSEGVWRLECMPDVVEIADPFGRANTGRMVRRTEWNEQAMSVMLPDLSHDFLVNAINKNNSRAVTADGQAFLITPGTYVLRAKGKLLPKKKSTIGHIALDEFVAPKPSTAGIRTYIKRDAGLDEDHAEAHMLQNDLFRTELPGATNLFDARRDRYHLMIMNPDWRKYVISYTPDPVKGDTVMQVQITDSIKGRMYAWQLYIGKFNDKGIDPDTLQMQINTDMPVSFRVGLVDIFGTSFYIQCQSDSTGIIRIPLSSLTPGPSLLLPRPYPGFQALWFDSRLKNALRISAVDKLEFIYTSDGESRTISFGRISLY